MRRKVPAVERSMGGLLRMAKVAVMALMFGMAGLVASAEAATVTYNTEKNNGTTLGAFTTNWSEAAGVDPLAPKVTSMSVGGTFGTAAGDRVEAINFSGTTDILHIISRTAYASAQNVAGVSFRGSLRTAITVADYQFDLGYINDSGFTSFGNVTRTGIVNSVTAVTIDLSSISGTAPSGSYLCIKVSGINGDGSNEGRVYLWETGNQGQLIVDETVACTDPDPSTITVKTGQTANGDPYSVATIFDSTGDVGSFEYKVAGSSATATSDTYVSSTTWTAPAGVTSVDVEVWGGGGGGGGQGNTTSDGGGGGGGGAYSKKLSISVVPGNTYTVTVGGGGGGGNDGCGGTGGDSWFSTNGTVLAKGGTGGCNSTGTPPTGGLGGDAAAGIGDTKFSGGQGEIGRNNNTGEGGYGGSSAGTGANGWSGPQTFSTVTYPTVNTPTGGGDGGNGGGSEADGFTPATGSGGGGGGSGDGPNWGAAPVGGAGAAGKVIITYYPQVTCTDWTTSTSIPATTAGGSLCGDYTDGGTYYLDVRGTDPDCTTVVASSNGPQAFTWIACTEYQTLTLDAIADPLSGTTATISATGTAANILVGTTDPPTQASGWIYTIPQDSTASVTFYAQGDGDCGILTDSQTVTLATMVAPTITAFTIPATVTDTAAPLEIPITAFTATDNVGVTGYMITESATAPGAGDAGWLGSAPTSYTVDDYGPYTLYAWAKDAAGNVSSSASAAVTLSDCIETVTGVTIDEPIVNPITGVTVISATRGGSGGGTPQVRWTVDGGAASSWQNSGTTFTPPANNSTGSILFEAQVAGYCAGNTFTDPPPVMVGYDTRLPGLTTLTASGAQSGVTGILVTMPYQGDSSGNATFQVDYKLASSGTWTYGAAVNPSPEVNPYTVSLLGLTADSTYNIRVTYADPDGVTGTAVQSFDITLVTWADSALLHNALRFACSKPGYSDSTSCTTAGGIWELNRKYDGGWGIPSSQYGPILCSTCHTKGSGNIKRVAASVSAATGSFPGSTISFTTAIDGSSDFGNDSGGHATSTKVCEVCHSQNKFHNYDTANNATYGGDLTHYNQADCVRCHEHKQGFRASCTACHGNPPTSDAQLVYQLNAVNDTGSRTWGQHQLHAIDRGYACDTCHYGWETSGEMPKNGYINIGFGNYSSYGDYDGRTVVSGGKYTPEVGRVGLTQNGTLACSGLYCHGTGSAVWTDTATVTCGSCHGITAANPPAGGPHLKHAGSASGGRALACATCHYGYIPSSIPSGMASHVNFQGDNAFDPAQPYVSGASYDRVSAVCSNLYCHSNVQADGGNTGPTFYAVPVWGEIPVCGDCHGDTSGRPATGSHAKHPHACSACHTGAGDETVWHADYVIQIDIDNAYGATATYSQGNAAPGSGGYGTCANVSCHGGTTTPAWGVSGTIACTDCHNTIITHITDSRNASATCTHCHVEQHSTAVPVNSVLIPNNLTVGIDYDAGGIHLAKTIQSVTNSTEAEICWACHDAQTTPISEWGTNTDTNGTLSNYNFGTVYTDASKASQTSRWIGTYWTSANFSYKEGWLNNKPSYPTPTTGTINGGSTHAAAAGAKGIDPVASIRCSYCHDVHNTAALTVGFAGAANDVNGKPYLRGRWVGNPYKEDGAPRAELGTAYYPAANDSTNPWGRVPRGSAAMGTVMGGYWIDQNNGNPIAPTYTATQFGGLCDLCHGATKDGAFTAAEINALNQYDAVGAGWVSGVNGHSNSVHGGTDSTVAARNIFAGRGGATNQDNTDSDDHPYMGFFGTSFSWSTDGGFRAGNSAWRYAPAMSTRPMDGDGWASTGWNNLSGRTLDWDGSTIDAAFHSFSCSKCHTPHASRLPALMITNCLDTKNNTWDNAFQVHGTNDIVNAGRSISNWSSAQNCHRLGGDDPSDTRDTAANTATAGNKGWNTVTPW